MRDRLCVICLVTAATKHLLALTASPRHTKTTLQWPSSRLDHSCGKSPSISINIHQSPLISINIHQYPLISINLHQYPSIANHLLASLERRPAAPCTTAASQHRAGRPRPRRPRQHGSPACGGVAGRWKWVEGMSPVMEAPGIWNGSLLKWCIYYIEKDMKKSGKNVINNDKQWDFGARSMWTNK